MNMHVDSNTTGTALIAIEDITPDNAPLIFGQNSLSRFVELARAEVVGEVPDLTTDKGRKRIASLAAKVARSKTAVDGAGRAYLKKLKEMPKTIEAELREFTADMDALRDEVRKPLNEYEAAEVARKDAIEDAVQGIIDLSTVLEDATSAEIEQQRANLQALIINEATYQERLEEAEEKRKYCIDTLTAALAKRQQYENEQAELVENRRKIAAMEEEARIKAAADKAVEDERQRVAQEQQAQRDADAQRIQLAEQEREQAKQDLILAEQRREQAERDRIAAEQRAEDDRIAAAQNAEYERQQAEQRQAQAAEQARQQEQQRQQRELDEQQRQQQARDNDKAHRGAINKAALEALMMVKTTPDGIVTLGDIMDDDALKQIIAAIIRGQIPNVSIKY